MSQLFKNGRWLYFLTILVALLYCWFDYRDISSVEEQGVAAVDVDLFEIPEIAQSAHLQVALSRPDLWGLREVSQVANNTSIEDTPGNRGCSLEHQDLADILVVDTGTKERWMFTGVVLRDKQLGAVFHNPQMTEKPVRIVPLRGVITRGVQITQLDLHHITVTCSQEDGGKQTFDLNIFATEINRKGSQ